MKNCKSLQYWGVFLILVSLASVSCRNIKIPVKPEAEIRELKGNDLKNYNYLFSEAIKQKLLGNYGQAIVYFEQCLDINENSDAAMFELSSIFSYARDYPKALQFARMAAYADSDNLWYQLQLASLYDIMKKPDSNLIVLESIVERYPDRMDILFQLGGAYSNEDYNEKAISVFNKLEKRIGFKESVSIAKTDIFRKTQQNKKAEEEIYRLISAYPENIEYQIILAEIFYVQGENEKAKDKYDEIKNIYDKNDNVKISLIQYYRQNENYEEMLNMIDSVLVNDYSRMEIKFNLVVSLITDQVLLTKIQDKLENILRKFQNLYKDDIRIFALIGDFYVKTRQYEKAARQFKTYIGFDTDNYLVWEQLLYLLNILDEPEELYSVSNEALKIFSGAPIIYFFNGIACTEIGKNKEAVSVLQRGLSRIVENKDLSVQFYSLLGEAYKNLEKHEDSDRAFEEALLLDPGNLIVLNNYSYYLSLRGADLKRALNMSRKCIEKEPYNSTYLDTYGWVLFNLKKYNSSQKYLKKAIENETNPSVEILGHYGDVNVKLKKYELAIEYWKMAIDAGGKEEEFLKKIRNAEIKKSGKRSK